MTIKDDHILKTQPQGEEHEDPEPESSAIEIPPPPSYIKVALKPVHPPFFCCRNNCLPMEWTYSRAQVPPELSSGGIDLSMWQQTHDQVRRLIRQNQFVEWLCVVPMFYTLALAPCALGLHKWQESSYKNGMYDLASQEWARYVQQNYANSVTDVSAILERNVYGADPCSDYCGEGPRTFEELVGIVLEYSKHRLG